MSFNKKYSIQAHYLTAPSKRRSGLKISPSVKFIVAHDTGNPESSALGNVKYYENSKNEMSASAHIFVDDKDIIECIPALTSTPEKAWHVLYNLDSDNKLFGFNANDTAIGVEYCYGTKINADQAYDRYCWVMAYICFTFNLDPAKSIVGHFFLDPQRKSDPVTGLAHSRRTYEQLLRDVVIMYQECLGEEAILARVEEKHRVKTVGKLNLRKGKASTRADIVKTLLAGEELDVVAYVNDGESVNGNSKWFITNDNSFLWAGGVNLV